MFSDNEDTDRGIVERSPFLNAYLEFDQQVFKAIRLRDELLRALVTPTVGHKELRIRAEQVFAAWEAAEHASGLMDESKQHQEQPLFEQASRLLEENSELTADILEQAAYRLVDGLLIDRATQLRERAHLRHPPTTRGVAPAPAQP
jgi:hypothetical protein